VVVPALVAVVLATAYAALTPPWAIEDEEQHIDYAVVVAGGHVPRLDDVIQADIAESVLATDRHGEYGFPRPISDDPATWGLEGRSYVGYHPPVAPLLLAPAALATKGNPLRLLVLGRVLAVITIAVASVGVARLARRWAGPGDGARRAALLAGVTFAALPITGDVGGRVSNDTLVGAFVVWAAVLCASVAERPADNRRFALALIVVAAATATKATGLCVLPVVGWAALVLARRHGSWRRGATLLGAALAPPALWAVATQRRYGTFDGTQAFLDRWGAPFPSSGADASLPLLVRRMLLPQAIPDWSLPLALPVALLTLIGLGWVLLGRTDRRPPTLAALTVLAAVALFVVNAERGLVTAAGRLVLPALAVAVAAAAAGWARWRAGWAVPIAVWLCSAWFLVGPFAGTYPRS
jgi:4-amino-4-deoxy-L-arabinose transferase-like glycosyltransferase